MKSVLLLLVLAAPVAPLPLRASQDAQLHTASPTELGCIKVLLAQERAWNRGDLDGFAKGYKDSPSTIFISGTVSRGYDQMLANYHREYPDRATMGTLGFSGLEVTPLDEHFAVVIGKYHLDRGRKQGGNADGIFSLVMEKTADGWKIVVDHTT